MLVYVVGRYSMKGKGACGPSQSKNVESMNCIHLYCLGTMSVRENTPVANLKGNKNVESMHVYFCLILFTEKKAPAAHLKRSKTTVRTLQSKA